jgi:hypothetical protein
MTEGEMQPMPIAGGGGSSKMAEAKMLIVPHLTRKNGFIAFLFLCGCVMMMLALVCVPDERDHELSEAEKKLMSCPSLSLGIAGNLLSPHEFGCDI